MKITALDKIKALTRNDIDQKSTKEIAALVKVSEATALKALNKLADEEWAIGTGTLRKGENNAGNNRRLGSFSMHAPVKYFWFFC